MSVHTCHDECWSPPCAAIRQDALKARIKELEAEKESWGNEFNAVIIMKDQLALASERAFQLMELAHAVATASILEGVLTGYVLSERDGDRIIKALDSFPKELEKEVRNWSRQVDQAPSLDRETSSRSEPVTGVAPSLGDSGHSSKSAQEARADRTSRLNEKLKEIGVLESETVTYQRPGPNCSKCGSWPCDCGGPSWKSAQEEFFDKCTQCDSWRVPADRVEALVKRMSNEEGDR